MENEKEIRFFPVFMGATVGVLLDIIGILVDEFVVGTLFDDAAFASVNLVEPYTYLETFLAYLVGGAAAALIRRVESAGDKKKMSEIFSQTLIVAGICGTILTLIYVLFTPQLIRLVANDASVYENSLAYFTGTRFYPLVDMFDTFLFTYVLYRGGYVQFYTALFLRIGVNALLSWELGQSMGLFGVGIASILSLIVAVLVKSTFLLTKKHDLPFRWYFNIREVLEIAKIGLPESMIFVYIVLLEVAVNNFTLKHYAAAGVAAIAVVVDIFEFTIYFGEGISEFEIVAVNDSIGKNSRKRMDRALKITKRAALIGGVH